VKRREFITLLGGAAAAWPLAARAQQAPIPVVGVLDSVADAFHFSAFRNGLSEVGYIIGHNVVLDVRSTTQYDQLPALAADLVSSHPAVLVALGGPATPAVKAASTTIPIVFSIGGDPVELGFVANISRPGGNVTGTTFFTAQLLQKQAGIWYSRQPTESPRRGRLGKRARSCRYARHRGLRGERQCQVRLRKSFRGIPEQAR
jgi:putative ABC transport system substrate-binding protein